MKPLCNRLGLLCCALLLLLTGCALPERGWIAGTTMRWRQYESVTIGVLPLSVNPQFAQDGLPTTAIERAVIDALAAPEGGSFTLQRVTDPEPGSGTGFPLTPKRLLAKGKVIGSRALVGISVAAWTKESIKHGPYGEGDAQIDLIITFADIADSSKEWIVSGTWSARSTDKLPEEIRRGLPLLLLDLRFALAPNRVAPWFTKNGDLTGPLLTYLSPDRSLGSGTGDIVTGAKTLALAMTTIDDEGIADILVENKSSKFRWRLIGAKNAAEESPIFLGSQLMVPLAKGANKINITSRSTDPKRTTTSREFGVTSTAERGLLVQSVAVGDYQSFSSVPGAARAANGVASASRDIAAIVGPVLINEKVTTSAMYQLVEANGRQLASGDDSIFYYAGRAVLVGSSVFLALSDYDAASQRGSLLRVEDLPRSEQYAERVLALDLCADERDVKGTLVLLAAVLNSAEKTIVSVVPCSQGVGSLGESIEGVLSDRSKRYGSAFSAEDFFKRLLERVRPRGAPIVLARAGATEVDFVYGQPQAQGSIWDRLASLVSSAPPPNALSQSAPDGMALPESSYSPSLFYVVAYSTDDLKEALLQAQQYKAAGEVPKILLGTSGNYSVTIGQSRRADLAYELLRRAQAGGTVGADAFVISPDRVGKVVPVACGEALARAGAAASSCP